MDGSGGGGGGGLRSYKIVYFVGVYFCGYEFLAVRLAVRTTIHETTRDHQIPCWLYKILHLLNAGCIKPARLAS